VKAGSAAAFTGRVVTADKAYDSKAAPADQGRRRRAGHSQPQQCGQKSALPQAHPSSAAQDRELLLSHQGLGARRHRFDKLARNFLAATCLVAAL